MDFFFLSNGSYAVNARFVEPTCHAYYPSSSPLLRTAAVCRHRRMLGECSPQQGAAPLQATQIQIEEMLPKLNYR